MKYIIGTTDTGNVHIDPFVLADTRAIISASSGGGKSYLLRKIAELIASKIQTILIDPEGEFPTLREKLDILIVSPNGDLQADVKSAGLLARKLAETGVSAVLDLYDLPGKADPWIKRRAFLAEFIESLMNLPKSAYHPMVICIDEAHNFAPEDAHNESSRSLEEIYQNSSMRSRSAVRSLMSAGRKRGFGGILATQRISKIDKDSIADARNVFIGGTTLDIDQRRAGDILGMGRNEFSTLRDLDPGNFYAFGPCLDQKGIVSFRVGQVETTHPKAGQRSGIIVPKASDQIKSIVDQLGDIPAEAEEEENLLAALQSENTQLRRQLRERPTEKIIQPETKIQYVDKPVIPSEFMDLVREAIARLEEKTSSISFLGDELRQARGDLGSLLNQADEMVKRVNFPILTTRRQAVVDPAPNKDIQVKRVFAMVEKPRGDTSETLTGPQQRIIDAIAWMETIGIPNPNISIVALLSGYTNFRSKGFTNPVSSLNVAELIRKPDGRTICLTPAGKDMAVYPDQPRNTKELQDIVFDKLPGPEKRILSVLVERGEPYPIDRVTLAERCGYSNDRSKGFTNPLSRLKVWRLIEKVNSDQYIAARLLFMDDE